MARRWTKVLLLDEPTRGIDVNAKREIYTLIDELARDGLGIVVASSEMPEILALADRILVLADGRVTASLLVTKRPKKACSRRHYPGENRRKPSHETLGSHGAHCEVSVAARVALLLIAMSLASDSFLTVANGLNVLRQISINLCLSIGMTMIILSGGIDLSVGSVMALSGAIAAGLLKNGIVLSHWGVVLQFTVFGAIVAGIAVGLAAGWINGFVITRFRVPPFVATLGMLSIARGLTQLWTGNFPITNLGDEFRFIGTGYWLGVPMPVWISAILVLIFAFVTRERVSVATFMPLAETSGPPC